MEAFQRKALVDAFESAILQAGAANVYPTMRRLRKWADTIHPVLQAMESRESLEAYFTDTTQADEDRFQQFLPLLIALPKLIQSFLEEAIRGTAERLPKGPAGRPLALTTQQKRTIVEHVSSLHAQGTAMGLAQTRASQKLGVGRRTVQRVWQQRAQLSQPPAPTMDDVWKLFIPQG